MSVDRPVPDTILSYFIIQYSQPKKKLFFIFFDASLYPNQKKVCPRKYVGLLGLQSRSIMEKLKGEYKWNK